jgi:hypothetical protein
MFELDFPGRTDIGIKNRYHVLMRKRMRQVRIRCDVPPTSAGQQFHVRPVEETAGTNLGDPTSFWDMAEFEWDDVSQL